MIEKYYGEQVRKFTRYATLKDTKFDIPRLQLNIEKLPPEFQIHSIDASLYDEKELAPATILWSLTIT